ncbi:hypothetical protein ACLIKE_03020 [Ferroplasma acidiphilum]|uniref:Iron-sulfur cluster loop n=1 Tax=Ferroplasma acidiphilum TaxID=74969 RepID=A0A7K4FQX0_9ARCH|nr:hypothetical protein [Ferroplasma acidiphilum]NOL60517.1 hypothetical protein [Ferroplasma acidiphilum]
MEKAKGLNLQVHADRGRKLADMLIPALADGGILGHKEMPEDALPEGVEKGSLEHIRFITMVVALDYMRDANALWRHARDTYADPGTRYLFNPSEFSEDMLHGARYAKVRADMEKYSLSQKSDRDAGIWIRNAISLKRDWGSNPCKIFKANGWDAVKILECIRDAKNPEDHKPAFLNLKGEKIGPLWIRMLRDSAGLEEFKNLEDVPMPVDIHVARATLACGVVTGSAEGFRLDSIRGLIRNAWKESMEGSENIPLDVDEALWHLSKYGCTHRDKETGDCRHIKRCEARSMCLRGAIHLPNGKNCKLNTHIP